MKPRKPLPRRRKPIARSMTPLKRTPLAREGKRGRLGRLFRKAMKALYFKLHGNGETAPCQYCGGPMVQDNCATHHKRKRSLGGKDTPENAMVVHHVCHDLIHATPTSYQMARDSPANVLNGKILR